MLNGIGGRTIAEAKENVSHAEALAWANYRNKHGSLNIGRRIEHGVGLLAVTWLRSQGIKADIFDFMPYADRPEEKLADINEIFGMFKALKKAPSK